jgi:ATP-binding cassette subfamily C protein CydD
MARTPQEKHTATARRKFLAQAASASGARIRAATVLLVLDGVAAIGLALGLAGGLTTISAGLPSAAPWLALLLASAVTRGAITWLGARVGAAASARIRAALRRRAVVACLGLPPGAQMPLGEKMTVAVDAVEQMDGYFSRFLPAQRSAGLVSLLVLAATACASPIAAGLLATTLAGFIALMIIAGGAAADESRRQFAALALLSGLFTDRIRSLPTILSFQGESAQAASLAAASDDLRRRTMSVLRRAFLSSAGLEFFAALSVASIAIYAGFDLLGLLPFPSPEHLDIGRAIFILALAPEFFVPMRRLAAAYHDLQAAETAADRLIALNAAALHPSPPAPPLRAAPRIRFEAATVRYANEDRAALENLSFIAEPGEIVALLGPSGAGKTTALNLLLNLAPLAGGEVWINDTALSASGSLAGSVAWMGQSPVIMPGSIADNVLLAHRAATGQQVEAAAERAGLCAMLRGRPDGLAAQVDERGSGLSGGERRRIALARALLKPAPIMLLDEPTAHLDDIAEAELIAAIRQAARGRTTIIATHSAALAAIADKIVRLEP